MARQSGRPGNLWAEYIQQHAGDRTNEDIGQLVDVSGSTVGRWFNGKTRPTADHVIRFARAVRQPPVEALIAAGFINESELKGVVLVYRSRRELSDSELLVELGERLAERPVRGEVDDITSALAGPDDATQSIKDDTGLI